MLYLSFIFVCLFWYVIRCLLHLSLVVRTSWLVQCFFNLCDIWCSVLLFGQPWYNPEVVHHYHLSLNREGRWGTTNDFTTSFLHFPLFCIALRDLVNSRPVHSLMLSSHLFLCLHCLLLPFIVPCKIVLARPDERETWPYHCSLSLFTIIRRFSCGPVTCWILARTSSLVTWSLYEIIVSCGSTSFAWLGFFFGALL